LLDYQLNRVLADPCPFVSAHAEALLRTSSSTTSTTIAADPRPLPPHVDLSWPVLTPSERQGDHERLMQRLQSQVTPPMDRAFEGLDMLANLTEDIPDFWGAMDPVLAPDALSTTLAGDSTTQLPTPFDGGYPPAGNGSSVSPAFETLFPSTQDLEEPIPLSDLASLYRIPAFPLSA
jgi:hypothetical protein